jgi:hypothetical protein
LSEGNFVGIAAPTQRDSTEREKGTALLSQMTKVINVKNRLVEFHNGEQHTLTSAEINSMAKVKPHPRLLGIATESEYLNFLREKFNSQNAIDEATTAMKLTRAQNAVDALTNAQFDAILKKKIASGYPINHIPIIIGEVETEKRRSQEEQAKRDVENQRQMAERQRPPNVFMRLAPHIGLKQYEEQLIQAMEKATAEDLTEIQQRLLGNEGRTFSQENRTKALAFINALIQARQGTNNESLSPLEKIRKTFQEFRGH